MIQNKILTDGDLSKIYSFTVWTGVLLAVLFFAASWPIAAYYEKSILKSLCQWLSVNLLFASVNIVPNALLHKAKRFRFLAVRNLVVQVGGGAVSIVAALCGAGLYALIVNPILSSVLLFVLSYRAYPQRLRPTFGLDAIRKIFSFSAYQFLFNAINYFSRNLDKLLIGKCMGMTPLGYYEKSYRLMMLPLQNITHVISPVMHPVFSEFSTICSGCARRMRRLSACWLSSVSAVGFSVVRRSGSRADYFRIAVDAVGAGLPDSVSFGRRTDRAGVVRRDFPGG